jgi:hypothetical protein
MKTYTVLYTRKFNENADTALMSEREFNPGTDFELLSLESSFCRNWDDDMLVKAKVYETRQVNLPDWMSLDEWLKTNIAWSFLWIQIGSEMANTLPESWQRTFLMWNDSKVLSCVKLLNTKTFRSELRRSLCEQLKTWLDTPKELRKFESPFSSRQWEVICDERVARDAKRTSQNLYNSLKYSENCGLRVT